jgi:Uma2 family endonuclease
MSTAPRRISRSKRMTTEQYLSGPPDEFKHELIYGELVMSPSPTGAHQDHELDLAYLLKAWVRAEELGWVWPDLDMVLDPVKHLVYRPDVLFLARNHESRRQRGRVFGPADLTVEILSPSDSPRRQRRKFADYERYGVSWYWVLDPANRTLEENELVQGVYVCRTEVAADAWFKPCVFPGLEFKLGTLLEGDLKAAVRGKAKKLV